MCLQDIQKLHGLHFKPETAVDHQKHQIGNLAYVDHRIDIVVAFDKCNATIFTAHYSHGSRDVGDSVLRIATNKTAHKSSFTHALRPDNSDNHRWWLLRWGAINKWNMQALLIELSLVSDMFVCRERMSCNEGLNYGQRPYKVHTLGLNPPA